jgi:hypothetical protein
MIFTIQAHGALMIFYHFILIFFHFLCSFCLMKQIPFTADLLTMPVMQLAMLVQPLALPHPSEELIQVQ